MKNRRRSDRSGGGPRETARRFRRMEGRLRCLLLSALFGASLLTADTASAAVLDLTAARGPAVDLEVGDDLWVEASGLRRGLAVDAVLADDAGRVLARRELRRSPSGSLGPTLLWFRSGVVGCDACRLPDEVLPLEFATFEDAEGALDGRTFSVRLEIPGRRVLARRALRWAAPQSTRYFVSDAAGCPRYRIEVQEEVYLAAYGAGGGQLRVFVAGARPSWEGPGRLFNEARGLGQGTLLQPQPGAPELLATSAGLPPGAYAAVLRQDVGDTRQVLTGGEIILHGPQDFDSGPTTDDGLVINDWGSCSGPAGP